MKYTVSYFNNWLTDALSLFQETTTKILTDFNPMRYVTVSKVQCINDLMVFVNVFVFMS